MGGWSEADIMLDMKKMKQAKFASMSTHEKSQNRTKTTQKGNNLWLSSSRRAYLCPRKEIPKGAETPDEVLKYLATNWLDKIQKSYRHKKSFNDDAGST